MKKALIVLLLLGMVAGGLFAQEAPTFTIQGRADAWWVPFQFIDRDGDSVMGAGLGRDANNGNGPRARIFIEGKTDVVGLKIQLQFYPFISANNYNPGAQGIGNTQQYVGFDDNVMVWWKPVEAFELNVGKFVADPLRGKIGNNWMKAFTVGAYDEDEIFSRFRSQGMTGSSTNVGVLGLFRFGDLTAGILFPGLDAFMKGAAISGGGDKGATYETVDYSDGLSEFAHVYERIQIGIGYDIADIGFARVQYIGANKGAPVDDITAFMMSLGGGGGGGASPFFTATTNRIEAAFALTAVQNLVLDMGFKIPFAVGMGDIKEWNGTDFKWEAPDGTGDAKLQNHYQVSVGAKYTMDAFIINGRVDGKFLGYFDPGVDGFEKIEYGPELNVAIWPTYNLGFMTVGANLGFGWVGESKYDGETIDDTNGTRFGFGAYAEKVIGSCTIRGGLAYRAAGEVFGQKEDGVFSIPITFDYTF